MAKNSKSSSGPVRRDPPEVPDYTAMMILVLALIAGGMAGMALFNLIEGDGLGAIAKAVLLTGAATLVTYATNRLAIEKGAPLAVIGYRAAAALSVGSISFVGLCLYAMTYAGLVYKDIPVLDLQVHGTAISEAVAERNAAAAKAESAAPVVSAAVADLTQKLACETASSCISGRGGGGYGPVARAVEEALGRAQSIAGQVLEGQALRDRSLNDLNALIEDYQETLGDTGRDIWERRTDLQAIDARIAQRLADLDRAMPLGLLGAYAGELQSGTVIAGRPDATARLNAILNGHGRALSAVVREIESTPASLPSFPKRTGIADAFRYIGHFAPVAGLTAVVELVIPLTLWLYTYFILHWDLYRLEPPRPRAPRKTDPFHGLLKDKGHGQSQSPSSPVSVQITRKPTAGNQKPNKSRKPLKSRRRGKPAGLNGTGKSHHSKGGA